MSPDVWIGWDLGAAHLKAVLLDRAGRAQAAAMLACPWPWEAERFTATLRETMARLGQPRARHAMTMTGELAGRFEDRQQGVETLVALMRDCFPGERLMVYAGTAGLVGPEAALGLHAQVASGSWMATASLAAGRLPRGLLVDIGSAATDLIPFADREVLTWGANDHERLIHGELLCSGMTRTPLITLARQVPFDGAWVPLMAEPSATTADLYRLTGDQQDDASDQGMANARRLARMLRLDTSATTPGSWIRVAEYLAECQLRGLADAATCLFSRGELGASAPIVGAGVGRPLTVRLAERLKRSHVGFESLLQSQWSGTPALCDCATAAAVACLAVEADS